MALSESELQDRFFKLGTIFKPSTPINRVDLFAGRMTQRAEVVDAINQGGQHIALYGEPGVGKTSLANMLFPTLTSSGRPVITPLINCAHQDTFSTIWKHMLEEIVWEAERRKVAIPEDTATLLSDYTQQYADEITPDLVRRVLSQLGDQMIFVGIVDEFNTVQSNEVRHMMSDTIKYLSDRNVPATVVVIGVADDVESLIGNHRSIERCLVQVRMPRMSHREIESLVQTCLAQVEMDIEKEALRDIRRLSKGLPHYAHLLGLHAGRDALSHKVVTVSAENVSRAIRSALGKTQASIQGSYRRAITSNRKDAQYREVLLACAMTPTDEFGYFSAKDVCVPLSHIRKKESTVEAFSRHLHAFSEDERGPVLRKEIVGKGQARYRFWNPLLQPFVLLKGVADGLISEPDLTNEALVGKEKDLEGGRQQELFD